MCPRPSIPPDGGRRGPIHHLGPGQSSPDGRADGSLAAGDCAIGRGWGLGAFYHWDEPSQRLTLLGGYAWRERKNLSQHIALGEGLVGQCALERAPITITQPPEDYIRIDCGVGEMPPKAIALVPVGPGLTLEIIERTERTRLLLEQTQIQAASLAASERQLTARKDELELINAQVSEAEERSRLILGSISEGIVGLGAEGFDIVLMDMQMPVMDGVTATKEIRAKGFAMPILAMTANAMQAYLERCLDAGMNDHLAKPINPDELEKALAHWAPKISTPSLDAAGLPVNLPGLDAATLRELAHGLKGTANTAGAIRLGRLAGDLEEISKAGDAETASQLLPLLPPTLAELQEALSSILPDKRPS